jgi:N-acyl-D-glucosamine 2-epimerase
MDCKAVARQILTENILPFWMNEMVDTEGGGFYGRISGEGLLHPEAEKGGILCGRTLWAFSAAYRVTGDKECLKMANRAKRYLLDNFYDKEFGGIYWSLDSQGRPLDTKKQFYAIGFAIYGLSEYARACRQCGGCYRSGADEALEYAVKLFECIEAHSYDPVNGGYLEACTRDWRPIEDMRLSDKDENEAKTMNTHLHILEPYANLLRVWDSELLKSRLKGLIELFLDKIEDGATHHLGLFFDEEWKRHDTMVSYGHDIEASWLLLEAAEVLGDQELLSRVKTHSDLIAKAASEGLQPDGSMIYEVRGDGTVDRDRHWWVQAETVVGFHYNALLTDSAASKEASEKCLKYIIDNIIDWKKGEWHWSRREDGTINTVDDKAGFWKCPYHNSRMCIELLTT